MLFLLILVIARREFIGDRRRKVALRPRRFTRSNLRRLLPATASAGRSQ
ncbi:hypothetical protein HY626_04460 [Candidatus Uhrbacteria bacterium]|nr:hypothetical protein [Candidatus Uhrbacteria bacterium]